MRLLRLDLKAVGPFTGVSLDLSAGTHGLHLIYGPNEAGKTSTLRALSHLLLGFPLRTPDDNKSVRRRAGGNAIAGFIFFKRAGSIAPIAHRHQPKQVAERGDKGRDVSERGGVEDIVHPGHFFARLHDSHLLENNFGAS